MARILLAEDDESMRTYIGRALERAGYAVTAVDRGTATLPLVATGGYDLLLTDIVMPEMDGRSEEHTAELQSLMRISYAFFCLKKKTSNLNISDQKITRQTERH